MRKDFCLLAIILLAVFVESSAWAAVGDTIRVSVASDDTEANGHSYQASISRTGRYIAFTSVATNLMVGDTNNLPDVFVHDVQTHQTIPSCAKTRPF